MRLALKEGWEYGQVLAEELVRFASGTDLYIGEAQYTDEEYRGRVGWGHSSLSATVGVALKAGVKSLALFHHDPMHSDETVSEMLQKAKRLIAGQRSSMECFAAAEGLVVEVWIGGGLNGPLRYLLQEKLRRQSRHSERTITRAALRLPAARRQPTTGPSRSSGLGVSRRARNPPRVLLKRHRWSPPGPRRGDPPKTAGTRETAW